MTYRKSSPSLQNLVFALLILTSLSAVAKPELPDSSTSPATGSRPRVAANYGNLPLSFEKNQGQADPSVNFLSRGSGYSLFLTDEGAVLALGKPADCPASQQKAATAKAPRSTKSIPCPTGATRQDVIRMTLARVPATSRALKTSLEKHRSPARSTTSSATIPSRWRSDLPTYAKISLQQRLPRRRSCLLRQPASARIRLHRCAQRRSQAYPTEIFGRKATKNRERRRPGSSRSLW